MTAARHRAGLRVGVLDLLTSPAEGWAERAYHAVLTKQYAAIMPQAIAVWCRARGHRTFYATYCGLGDPRRRLPDDLDVVFVSAYTQVSALAYALAKLYRAAGTRTVIGGPHAVAFPADCLRFFDLVVGECDAELVGDILDGVFDPGTVVSSPRPLADVPSVEARLPEIRASAFAFGRRRTTATTIPLLASLGCPYGCDFCVDADRPYRQLPLDRLREDLRWIARELPNTLVAFHDPNFAVKFDQVLDALETVPEERRSPYIVETSLGILRGERPRRLGATGCAFLAPGVESWSDYAGKSGVGSLTGGEKVERLVDHFARLHAHVPYLQANFLFGLDGDAGDEPVALTKAFMTRTPFVWPVVNIPHPFGGTRLFARQRAEGRVLEAMPFSFYYSPHLVTVPRHYSPASYYERLAELFAHFTSPAMLAARLRTSRHAFIGLVHRVRTQVKRRRLAAFRRILVLLASDRAFRDFHEGRSRELPEFYHREYERMLGRFAPLMSREDRAPDLRSIVA